MCTKRSPRVVSFSFGLTPALAALAAIGVLALPACNSSGGGGGGGAPSVAPLIDFASPESLFASSSMRMSGFSPFETADLNGDGRPDLVAGAVQGLSITAALGNATGEFSPEVLTLHPTSTADPLGSLGHATAVGDIDGDGLDDLVIADTEIGMVTPCISNGDGTFVPLTALAVGSRPRACALGDLDADGDLDIVTADHDADAISIIISNGDGTFEPASATTVGSGPVALRLGDLNGDGALDAALIFDGTLEVQVLPGDGTGDLGGPIVLPGTIAHDQLRLGDLDGDGDLDLVLASTSDAIVTAALNDGAAGFTFEPPTTTANSPENLHLADVDADSILDAIVSHEFLRTVRVHLGDGSGAFGAAIETSIPANVIGFTIADLDVDGSLDLAVKVSNWALVFRGEGDGTFTSTLPAGHPVTTPATPVTMRLADLDDDGLLDAVVPMFTTNEFEVLMGNEGGGFDSIGRFPGGGGCVDKSLLVVDVTGDGILDVVSGRQLSETIDVIPGVGNGTFTAATTLLAPHRPSDLAAADLDLDGDVDLVSASDGGALQIYDGLGGGTFAGTVPFATPPAGFVNDVEVADLTGDGVPEVVVATRESITEDIGNARVTVFVGSITAPPVALPEIVLAPVASEIHLDDVDGDGVLDLIHRGAVSNSFASRAGFGDGTFDVPITPTNVTINRIDRIADLNLDEIPDLIGRGFSLEGFIVQLGRIGGGYSPAAYFGYEAPANFYTGLELADIDGDGDIEVVTLSSHQQAVRVHDNRRN